MLKEITVKKSFMKHKEYVSNNISSVVETDTVKKVKEEPKTVKKAKKEKAVVTEDVKNKETVKNNEDGQQELK